MKPGKKPKRGGEEDGQLSWQVAMDKKPHPGSLYRVFQIFFAMTPWRWVLLIGCLTVASLFEGLGIVTVLPIFSIAVGGELADSGANRFVTDAIRSIGLPTDLLSLSLLALALIWLKSALTLFASTYAGSTMVEFTTRLRLTLLSSLFKVRWSHLSRQRVGGLGTIISSETFRAGEAFLNVAQTVKEVIRAVVFLTFALLISWQVAVLALVIGSLVVLSLNRFVRGARQAGRWQTKRLKKLVMRFTDVLIIVKPLKAMARHSRFGDLFAGDVRELNKALRKQVFSREATRSLQDPLQASFLALTFYIAYVHWQVPLSELIVMVIVMSKAISAMGKVQQTYITVSIGEAAYTSVRKAIDDATAQREVISGTRTPTLEKSCRFANVSFSFGSKPVLRDVTISIPAGGVTAITGVSGAGKTTFADLLIGLYRPDRGEVWIDDLPLGEIDLERWRGMVGYVPQEVILFHDTILKNVTLADPQFSEADARAALEAAGAWDFVDELPDGMGSIAGERGTMVSGGQRQRIAIARALVHRPKLLILDEATSALDPATEAEICRNLKELSERTGLTILAISHQRAWVDTADRVYHLSGHEVTLVRDSLPEVMAS